MRHSSASRDQGPRDVGLGLGLHHQHCREPDDPGNKRHSGRGHRGPVPLRPPPRPARKRLTVRRDGLIGHPALDVVGQCSARWITVLGIRHHRPQADRLSADRSTGRAAGASRNHRAESGGAPRRIVPLQRWLAGQKAVEGARPGCKCRRAVRGDRDRRRLARGSCTPESPVPNRAASRPTRWPSWA